jgi:hypothetical protein
MPRTFIALLAFAALLLARAAFAESAAPSPQAAVAQENHERQSPKFDLGDGVTTFLRVRCKRPTVNRMWRVGGEA